MQSNRQVDRAKQFLPFDALKGFREALYEKEKIKDNKKELSEEKMRDLERIFQKIMKGRSILIKHYENLIYTETIGQVKKINDVEKKIEIDKGWIAYENIIDVEIID